MNWKEELNLNEGDTVKYVNKFEAGHLGQKERYTYDIIDINGDKTGSVKYIVETNTKPPFKQNRSVAQYDKDSHQVFLKILADN